jgi:formylglycine-generating enzyme
LLQLIVKDWSIMVSRSEQCWSFGGHIMLLTLTLLALSGCTNSDRNKSADNNADRREAGQRAKPDSADIPKELLLGLGDNITMELVEIPPGKFLMGSPEFEKGRDNSEVQHEVTITKAFYMGVTHVTVGQFKAFIKESHYETDAEELGYSYGHKIVNGTVDFQKIYGNYWRKPSFPQTDENPVVQVSFNDARAFCDWLSNRSEKRVVLPTEAQWEYACRAGTKTAYPWGDNPDVGAGWANCADQSIKRQFPNEDPLAWTYFNWNDGFLFTSPVKSFKANAFGLYDMIGNAAQWCQDCYENYNNQAVVDPTGPPPTPGALRVIRGGSWARGPDDCRSASRKGITAGAQPGFYGFSSGSGGFRIVVLAGNVN